MYIVKCTVWWPKRPKPVVDDMNKQCCKVCVRSENKYSHLFVHTSAPVSEKCHSSSDDHNMIMGVLSSVGGSVWHYANIQTAAAQICTYFRIFQRLGGDVNPQTNSAWTHSLLYRLVSDMVLVASRILRNMILSVRCFTLKIQRPFFTGNSIVGVLHLLPVIKINKKHTQGNTKR